jgi:dynein light chain LC8-type
MAEEGEKKATEYQMTREHTYKIVTSFMPEAFEQDAIKISLVAVDKFKHLKDIAFYIKQQYDRCSFHLPSVSIAMPESIHTLTGSPCMV